jgi:hypothetical protein
MFIGGTIDPGQHGPAVGVVGYVVQPNSQTGRMDGMKDRDEHLGTPAHGGAAKPGKPAGEGERRFQDAIEDDEVREALGVPHQRKVITQGAG